MNKYESVYDGEIFLGCKLNGLFIAINDDETIDDYIARSYKELIEKGSLILTPVFTGKSSN